MQSSCTFLAAFYPLPMTTVGHHTPVAQDSAAYPDGKLVRLTS
jgi:hypothetical protein